VTPSVNFAPILFFTQACYALALCGGSSGKDEEGSIAVTGSDAPVNMALFKLGRDRLVDHYTETNPMLRAAGE
jgi:hypothetical protein